MTKIVVKMESKAGNVGDMSGIFCPKTNYVPRCHADMSTPHQAMSAPQMPCQCCVGMLTRHHVSTMLAKNYQYFLLLQMNKHTTIK
jgi:hypothetical protein